MLSSRCGEAAAPTQERRACAAPVSGTEALQQRRKPRTRLGIGNTQQQLQEQVHMLQQEQLQVQPPQSTNAAAPPLLNMQSDEVLTPQQQHQDMFHVPPHMDQLSRPTFNSTNNNGTVFAVPGETLGNNIMFTADGNAVQDNRSVQCSLDTNDNIRNSESIQNNTDLASRIGNFQNDNMPKFGYVSTNFETIHSSVANNGATESTADVVQTTTHGIAPRTKTFPQKVPRTSSGVSSLLNNNTKKAENDYGGAFYSRFNDDSLNEQNIDTIEETREKASQDDGEIFYDDSVNSGYSNSDLVLSHFGSANVDAIKTIEDIANNTCQSRNFLRQQSSNSTEGNQSNSSESPVKVSTTTFPSVLQETESVEMINHRRQRLPKINNGPEDERSADDVPLSLETKNDFRMRPEGVVKRQAPLPNVAQHSPQTVATFSNPPDVFPQGVRPSSDNNIVVDNETSVREFQNFDGSYKIISSGRENLRPNLFSRDDSLERRNSGHMTSTEDSVVPLLDPQPDLIPESVRRKPPKPVKPASLVANFRNSQAGGDATVAGFAVVEHPPLAISRSSSNSDSSGTIHKKPGFPRPVPPPRSSSVKSNSESSCNGEVATPEPILQLPVFNQPETHVAKDVNRIQEYQPGTVDIYSKNLNDSSDKNYGLTAYDSHYNTYDSCQSASNGIDIHVTVTVKPLAPGTLADLKQQRSLNRGSTTSTTLHHTSAASYPTNRSSQVEPIVGGNTVGRKSMLLAGRGLPLEVGIEEEPPLSSVSVSAATVAGEVNRAYDGADAEVPAANPEVTKKYRPPVSPSVTPQRFHGQPSEYPTPEESKSCCTIL